MSKITVDRSLLEPLELTDGKGNQLNLIQAIDHALNAADATGSGRLRKILLAAKQALAQPQHEFFGLESCVGHLSALVDAQRQLLVEVERIFGRDEYGIEFEDGDSEIIDKVRSHIAATTEPPAQPQQEPVAIVGSNFQLLWCREHWAIGVGVGDKLYAFPPAQPQQEPVSGYVSKIESLIKERDALKEQLSNPPESGGFKTVEIDGIKPELFAQQIAAAMRYADAPLSHDQFVTLVLYLKSRSEQ